VALFADFLGLPPPTRLQLSPELQRRKTIDLLSQWTLSLSTSQPLVMFVEDLHRCDASTLELLGHLMAQSPTARVLLLATAPRSTSTDTNGSTGSWIDAASATSATTTRCFRSMIPARPRTCAAAS
jgi:predicted ATPase